MRSCGYTAKRAESRCRTSLDFIRTKKIVDSEEDHRFFRDRVFAECQVWVVTDDLGIIGFCVLRKGSVDHLYAYPLYRRAGIGSSLMKKAMEHDRELQLWVFQRNEAAIRF